MKQKFLFSNKKTLKSYARTECGTLSVMSKYLCNAFPQRGDRNIMVTVVENGDPIYQPLRSGRIWHKVDF